MPNSGSGGAVNSLGEFLLLLQAPPGDAPPIPTIPPQAFTAPPGEARFLAPPFTASRPPAQANLSSAYLSGGGGGDALPLGDGDGGADKGGVPSQDGGKDDAGTGDGVPAGPAVVDAVFAAYSGAGYFDYVPSP